MENEKQEQGDRHRQTDRKTFGGSENTIGWILEAEPEMGTIVIFL